MTNLRSSSPMPRIVELESLRGLAAVLVIFYHIPAWHPNLNAPFLRNSYLMVDLFFCLSGFVIATVYLNKMHSLRDVLRFQFLRLGRLYPVHGLMLAVFLAIEITKYIVDKQFGIASASTVPFRENNVIAFLQQALLLQAIGPTGNAITFNGPAWSISVEFYTYLLFALIVRYCSVYRQQVFIVLFLVAVTLLILNSAQEHELLLRCFCGFFLGCFVSATTLSEPNKIRVPSQVATLAVLFLFLFLAFKPNDNYDVLIYFISAILLYSLICSPQGRLKTILRAKSLVWLGSISYSLYMVHFLVIWIFNQVARFWLSNTEVFIDGQMVPQMSSAQTLLLILVLFPTILALSSAMHLLIEVPFRQKAREIALKW